MPNGTFMLYSERDIWKIVPRANIEEVLFPKKTSERYCRIPTSFFSNVQDKNPADLRLTPLARRVSAVDCLASGIEADFVALVHLTDAGTRGAMEFPGVAISNI